MKARRLNPTSRLRSDARLALAKKPVAIALAALSTESVTDQLNKALAAKIPVIGFDSGVPNAPAGSVYANASTDNKAAGALGATSIYAVIKDKLAKGAGRKPIASLSSPGCDQ